jgi:DNA-dependent RNA polymerase auxiliary subunit epsilon
MRKREIFNVRTGLREDSTNLEWIEKVSGNFEPFHEISLGFEPI